MLGIPVELIGLIELKACFLGEGALNREEKKAYNQHLHRSWSSTSEIIPTASWYTPSIFPPPDEEEKRANSHCSMAAASFPTASGETPRDSRAIRMISTERSEGGIPSLSPI